MAGEGLKATINKAAYFISNASPFFYASSLPPGEVSMTSYGLKLTGKDLTLTIDGAASFTGNTSLFFQDASLTIGRVLMTIDAVFPSQMPYR
jgi:hypothetical protein